MAEPPIRVVSEQSDADIQRSRTREALAWPLRRLTANIMRIAKQGGRPVELLLQMEACCKALREYADAHGCLPDAQLIQDILDCDLAWREHRPWIEERKAEVANLDDNGDSGFYEREEAMRMIRRGALQAVASMLVDQLPQQRMGENDIHSGIRLMETAQAKSRAYFANPKRVRSTLSKLGIDLPEKKPRKKRYKRASAC